jgi:hypothetical protein
MYISYTIPGPDGTIEPGKRFVNWGWYNNCTEHELEERMTGEDGKRYKWTMPIGKMRLVTAEDLRKEAREQLPPSLVESVEKTRQPFAQVITDVMASKNSFFGGKVVLVGDAAACVRSVTSSWDCRIHLVHALILWAGHMLDQQLARLFFTYHFYESSLRAESAPRNGVTKHSSSRRFCTMVEFSSVISASLGILRCRRRASCSLQ